MNKINKTYHVNGSIDEEYEINKEGKQNGYYKLFHDNGQLKVETSFKNGIQNPGIIISYHSNGVRAREVILSKNGNFNGAFTEWHNNGNIKTQGYHKDDEKFIENEFYENGVLIDSEALKTESELNSSIKDEDFEELFKMNASFFLKMKEPHLKGWHDIIKDRGESQEMLCKTLKVSMDDYDYWAKGHVAEYIPRLNLKPGDPKRLDKKGLQYRIDIFNLIIEGLEGLITKSSELNIEANKELLNDYHAAKASKLASELAIKIIDEK